MAVCWEVRYSNKAARQYRKLPKRWRLVMTLLVEELKRLGPVRGNWPNYSKLGARSGWHHCHLNRAGRPTYVAVWTVVDGNIRIIEVVYAGTREKAPY